MLFSKYLPATNVGAGLLLKMIKQPGHEVWARDFRNSWLLRAKWFQNNSEKNTSERECCCANHDERKTKQTQHRNQHSQCLSESAFRNMRSATRNPRRAIHFHTQFPILRDTPPGAGLHIWTPGPKVKFGIQNPSLSRTLVHMQGFRMFHLFSPVRGAEI